MKKNMKTYAIAILSVLLAVAIFDNLRISDTAKKLEIDNEKLVEELTSKGKDLESSSKTSEGLLIENEELVVEIAKLEEDVEDLKTSVAYQDFKLVMDTVEEFKAANTINETRDLIAFNNGSGFGTRDREGNCPCYMTFRMYGDSVEWKQNMILSLKEFSLDKDKVLLTYHTVDEFEDDYQFIMLKSTLNREQEERWMIDEIKLVKKE
ncbi:hypothetical protein IM538_03520 [Cytobacillus suaedae]|nr:hypothetical protein IM538_03520 [Cytobacillus suaedae]